jgi:hypothetical protein
MSGVPSASITASAELPAPRAFGSRPDDLSLDFARLPQPALTSALLAACAAVAGSDGAEREHNAWSLPVGTRIAQLLRIVQVATDEDSLTPKLTCPATECRRPFEVALPVADLLRENGAAQNVVPFSTSDGAELRFRRATGRDQAEWFARSYASNEAAASAIVLKLIDDQPSGETEETTPIRVSTADVASLAVAMEAADPLVAFSIHTACPHCGAEADIAVDLEAMALDRLARHRRSLLRTVHRLATHYGWAEAEILALPADRRSEYLQLIEDES